MGRAFARWLGSIPNRPTNFVNTTNNPIDRKVRKTIRSFACDYETMARLAEIETGAILDQGDGEMVGAVEGREIALRTVLGEIEHAKAVKAKQVEMFDETFHFAIKLAVAVETGRLDLSPSEYRQAHSLLEALNQFAKHLK